jgi:autotransporter-associated beta strand protein
MPVCASVVLHGAITLASDCDWTGLGTLVIPDGVTIDLNGHALHLSGFTCLPDSAVTITDSTDGNGELHVTVAENDVLVNDRILLAGSMRLVKHGAGVFVASKMNQTYAGGTDVRGGFLRVSNKNLSSAYRGELGDRYSHVRIGEGAELLINGYYNQEFTYTFDGGTLASGASPKEAWRQISNRVIFTADGTVTGQNQAFMVGGYAPSTITMNGNTLHVNLDQGKEFTLCNATFADEGTISGEMGWVRIASNPCVGTNLTLQFLTTHGGVFLDKNFTVSNFVSHSANYHKGGDSAALKVLGTFTPAENGRTAFPNMILAGGSTLDLSQMDDVPTLPTSCTQVDGKTTRTRTIAFEDNATINVKLGTRKISKNVPIVGWTEPPSNIDSLTFKAVDRDRNFSISKRSDGLYLSCGLMIIVR